MPGRWLVALAALAVALTSAVPRLLLAAGALPEGLRPFIWSDVYATYVIRGLGEHRLPYVYAFFEYPPGIGYPAGVLALLTPNALAYTAAWAGIIAAVAAVLAFALWPHVGARRTLWFWSLSPQLLLYSGSNFDVLPAALVTGGAILARRGRSLAAVVLFAVGTATKLFPALYAPLEVTRLWRAGARARAWWAAALFVSVVVVLMLPTLSLPWSSLLSVIYPAVRTNEDSVWGLSLAALALLHVPEAETLVAIAASAGFVVTYLFGVMPRALRTSDPAVGFGLATVALLLWTRLYSPQFSLWVLPFFALLGLRGSTFALLSVADAGVFFSVYPLTISTWREGEPARSALFFVLLVAVVLRHVALLLAWFEVFRRKDAVRA